MIAVTGANGLLGSFIIRRLIEQNLPCIGLKRANSDTSLLNDIAGQFEWRNADVLDTVAIEEALSGVTKVIHAAAIVSFNPSRRDEILDNNVTGTRNLVNASLACSVERFIHISSVAALGRQKGQTVIDETNKWVDSALNSNYAESKYLSELEVFRGEEEGLNTVIVNPSVILAPADWNKSSAQLFKYVWQQKKFYIDGTLNYVDVRDVADVVVALLSNPVRGQRFVLNGGSVSFESFFQMVAAKFNCKHPSTKLNRRLLTAAAFVEGIRAKLLGGEPLITKETARLEGNKFAYSSDKIKEKLGFDFQTIENTLDWCCSHYLNFNAKK
ncbi:MAG TPA: NAD-dependent epimerase/dehydratase family protein [Chryseosolibacter sp.]|nr:NAD-dependent epimerase/dehydratase family protein [Chryseosolibacter sp.]